MTGIRVTRPLRRRRARFRRQPDRSRTALPPVLRLIPGPDMNQVNDKHAPGNRAGRQCLLWAAALHGSAKGMPRSFQEHDPGPYPRLFLHSET